MKILFVVGSPRKAGNTEVLVTRAADGIRDNLPDAMIETVSIQGLTLEPCHACDACKRTGGKCAFPGAEQAIIEKILAADTVVFASPVYFWGISAQLKTVIDKLYAKGVIIRGMKPKNCAVIAVGGAGTDNIQYRIIEEQFRCIFNYFGWKYGRFVSASASARGEVASNETKMAEINELWKYLN